MAVSHNAPPLANAGCQIMFQGIFRSDLGIWASLHQLPTPITRVLGSSQVQDHMTNTDKQYVDQILRVMQPASARQAGLYNDRIRGKDEVNLP